MYTIVLQPKSQHSRNDVKHGLIAPHEVSILLTRILDLVRRVTMVTACDRLAQMTYLIFDHHGVAQMLSLSTYSTIYIAQIPITYLFSHILLKT